MTSELSELIDFPRQLMSRATAYLMRWHQAAATLKESVAEHHSLTARMAYELAIVLEWNGYDVRPEEIAVAAMYHDEEELIVGDMPAPAKKLMPPGVLEQVAYDAINELWPDYPPDLQDHLRDIAHQENLSNIERQIVKYADTVAALAYVLDTVQLGNRKMVEVLEKNLNDEHFAEMDWDWLKFLRREWGIP